MTLLDTHAWIWWVNGSPSLSEVARETIERSCADSTLFISSMSVWEIALLVKKGRLSLSINVADWVTYSEGLPYLTFVPVNNRIALNAVTLPLHPDPADRIIVATALYLGSSLVTKDDKIHAFSGVESVW